MNHWNSYVNQPFPAAAGYSGETGPAEPAMPMTYYPAMVPYSYWCPPAMPMAPLVSPAYMGGLESSDSFDSPDSSNLMPPLSLGTMPNVAPASAGSMGGEDNAPPAGHMTPYGSMAPAVGMGGGPAPAFIPYMSTGVTPAAVPSAVPYAPMYYPVPHSTMPYGGYAAPWLPSYDGGPTPYAPGWSTPYIP
ncbi:hypothetical protein [Geobacillus sp. YF-1]|uniref:hypothetical protein n=1 Tax=Geobacillus sp. YF-1 TaxID=3457480 RepID=UPI0040463046